ncbi:MAG: tetratricopeptide repeat protein [Acidobacteriaceae bacterium]|nr:tetratricopeptide repeat protein [Acidobacteriaceae bacterium]
MFHRWCICWLFAFSLIAYAGTKQAPKASSPAHASDTLPVTTSSPAARRNFERAMRHYEDYHVQESLSYLRQAVSEDPKFAQAFVMIAEMSHEPVEQAAARRRAKNLSAQVSPGEQLLIRWITGAQENNYIQAIAAMNDLLAAYPRDKRVAFIAGGWLNSQQRYEQAAQVLQNALSLHPDYPAALNDIAYAYAGNGDFDKAFAAMEKYVALEPDDPNPHDSYAEILRMAGQFNAALEHYRMSVRIDPNFGSEVGIADTYALMGREQDARDEYDRAIVFAGSQSDRIQFELQSAATWIRENNRPQAEKALNEVAKHAHSAELARQEAEAQRVLAMYASDLGSTMKHVQLAQDALQEPHELSESDRNEELASILRVAATRAAEAKDVQTAVKALNQLQSMADKSRDQAVQLCYHGAAGAVLMAQGSAAEAISELEEDSSDPFSMQLLWHAYADTGAAIQAQALAKKLAALNVPTVEQALVVPQFRSGLAARVRQP